MQSREGGARTFEEYLKSVFEANVQIAVRQSVEELRVQLKAELQAELCLPRWGDPLDDQSGFRQGLRAELQAQLRMAALGTLLGDDLQALEAPPVQRNQNTVPSDGTVEQRREQRAAGPAPGGPAGDPEGALPEPSAARWLGDALPALTSTDARDDSRAEATGRFGLQQTTGIVEIQAPVSPANANILSLPGLKGGQPRLSGARNEVIPPATIEPHAFDVSQSLQLPHRRGSRNSEVSEHATGTLFALRNARTFELPDGNGPLGKLRRVCAQLVHSNNRFDAAMGAVIVANSICVGLEIQWDLDGDGAKVRVMHSLEHVFLTVFVVELVVRFLADGSRVRQSGWFMFDFALVIVGISSSWIVDPILRRHLDGASQLDESLNIFSQVLIIRVLRLLRLIRALRLLEAFQELWKLANGLMGSIRTVISAWLLVMITVYIFACLGIELINLNEELREDALCSEIIDFHFQSLPLTMLTLVQFANADSIASIYIPLVTKSWYLAIYFGTVWLIVTISLMNLVTGVIVDHAISQSCMDREMEVFSRRKMLNDLAPTIKGIFRNLDQSGDGKLTLSEVRHAMRDASLADSNNELPKELHDIVQPSKLADLFAFLDADGSGEIDEDEFLDGIFHLALQTVPIETTQTLQLLRAQARDLRLIRELAILEASEAGSATLTKDHKQGDTVLSCELEKRVVRISGGGRSERKPLRGSAFHLHLATPLRQGYPENAIVSQAGSFGGGASPASSVAASHR